MVLTWRPGRPCGARGRQGGGGRVARDAVAVAPVVGAAVVGGGVAEDVAVALRPQDGHRAVVVPADTAVLSAGAPRAPWPR